MNYPRLWPAVFLGLVGLAFLIAGLSDGIWAGKTSPGWELVRVLCTAAGGYLLIVAGLTVINWVAHEGAARVREMQLALAKTAPNVALEIMSRMSPEQLAVARQGGFTLDWIPGNDGSAFIQTIRTPGGDVPVDFFEQFLSLGDERYLVPVGTWGEGTNERNWAVMATAMMIGLGWAVPARGPHPAAWINREAAESLLERIEG